MLSKQLPSRHFPRAERKVLQSIRTRGPQKTPRKVPISIRLSPDVAEGLRRLALDGSAAPTTYCARGWPRIPALQPIDLALASQASILSSFDAIIDALEVNMRTTLALDDELIEQAQEFTGIAEKTALVREALRALIQREAARRLAALGGTMPELEDIPRLRVDEL